MKKVYRLLSLLMTLMLTLTSGFSIVHSEETTVKSHWADSKLKLWESLGLISGYADGSYAPDKPISRIEFIKLANKVFVLEDKAKVNFKDLKENDSNYNEIAKAVAAGYIAGYGDGTVRVNDLITRAQTAKILSVLMKLDTNDESGYKNFNDSSKISEWSRKYVSAAVNKGFFKGYTDNTFRQDNNIYFRSRYLRR